MTDPTNSGDPAVDLELYRRLLQQLRAELDQQVDPTEADERAVNELLGIDEEPDLPAQSLW